MRRAIALGVALVVVLALAERPQAKAAAGASQAALHASAQALGHYPHHRVHAHYGPHAYGPPCYAPHRGPRPVVVPYYAYPPVLYAPAPQPVYYPVPDNRIYYRGRGWGISVGF